MYTQLSAPLTHSLLLLGGCSVQQASLWSRLVYRLWSKGLRREDYPEREHSSLGFRRAQMAHSEAGGLKQELGEEKKNQRDAGKVLGPSGERSPVATDSPSKWRQSYSPSREWLANVPIPSFLRGTSISSIWCTNEAEQERGGEMRKGEGGGWCGGGEAGNLCVSFEACLMAFLCQVSLQGHSGNLALEGIRTLTIRGWVQASKAGKSLSV